MCHETDSLPPLPPIRGGAVDASEVSLTSADGTAFAGYLARAEAPGGPGIVVIPDVRGLHPFYLELARRLAEAGVHAVALDLYARTAGPGLRGADFEYMPHVNATERVTIRADVAAGIAALRDATGAAAERVYVMGFCFGGRAAFAQGRRGSRAGRGHRLLRIAHRPGASGPPRACYPCRGVHLPGPRPVWRRRWGNSPRERRSLRRGIDRGRGRTSARDLPGRPAFVLRPHRGGARRRGRIGLARGPDLRGHFGPLGVP